MIIIRNPSLKFFFKWCNVINRGSFKRFHIMFHFEILFNWHECLPWVGFDKCPIENLVNLWPLSQAWASLTFSTAVGYEDCSNVSYSISKVTPDHYSGFDVLFQQCLIHDDLTDLEIDHNFNGYNLELGYYVR